MQAKTPDGQRVEFLAPAGYGQKTQVGFRYKPVPEPMPAPKAKAKAKAKAKEEANPNMLTASAPGTIAARVESLGKDAGAQALGAPGVAMSGMDAPGTGGTGTPGAGLPGSVVEGADAASLEVPIVVDPATLPVQVVAAKVVHSLHQGLPLLPPQLPVMDGAWTWIRHANGEVHRITRADAGDLLRETFKMSGFTSSVTHPPIKVKFLHIAKMIKGTRILSHSQGLPKLGNDPKHKMEIEYGTGVSPIEKAQTLAQGNFNPATVSAASAYHAGGGFTSGGRHALEEAFCSQSTLYASLEKAMGLWAQGVTTGMYRNDNPSYHQHIPTDGCILSPSVEIFRGSSEQGYQIHQKPMRVAAVISVAMYNKNAQVRDAPVDAPTDLQLYLEGVRKKFAAMVHAAALSGADAIIIPDVGCGVFQNDPTVCGKIMGEVLLKYQSYFRRAVFTGRQEFYDAAQVAINSNIAPLQLSKRATVMTDASYKQAGDCVVCKRSLRGTGFACLALLIDNTHHSHGMQFLHDHCVKEAHKQFPKHLPMTLPRISDNADSFFQALDLNGNGIIEKSELKCICALLWDDELSTDMATFEADFDQRFKAWDMNQTGNLNSKEVTTVAPGFVRLDGMPQSLLEWAREQSRKCESRHKVAT